MQRKWQLKIKSTTKHTFVPYHYNNYHSGDFRGRRQNIRARTSDKKKQYKISIKLLDLCTFEVQIACTVLNLRCRKHFFRSSLRAQWHTFIVHVNILKHLLAIVSILSRLVLVNVSHLPTCTVPAFLQSCLVSQRPLPLILRK